MAETIQTIIGDFIKQKRQENNQILKDVSLIGFGHENMATQISKVERGMLKKVSIDTIDKIFIGLGLDLKNVLSLVDLEKKCPNDFELGNKARKILNDKK